MVDTTEDSIDPKKWGKAFWDTIHYAAAGYSTVPTEDRKTHATAFYAAIAHNLPCTECRTHAVEYVSAKPPVTTNRDTLFNWTVDFRNAVNAKLGLPQLPVGTLRNMYIQQKVVSPPPQAAPRQPTVPAVPTPRRINQTLANRALGINTGPGKATRGPIVAARNGNTPSVQTTTTIRSVTARAAPRRKKGCGCGR